MEKFSKWRDSSTGIQPFLPPRPPASDAVGRRIAHVIKYYVLGPLVAVLRLVLAAIVFLWLLAVTAVGDSLPLTVVRRGFLRYTHGMGGRVLLGLLGFWYIPTSWASLRRGRAAADAPKAWPGAGLASGDVIFANLTSYIDVLYLTFRFAPQFTEIVQVKSGAVDRLNTRLRPVSLWQALRAVTSAPQADPLPSAEGTYDLAGLQAWAVQHGRGPLVVFPEGTASNGRCILAFTPVLRGWTPGDRRMLIAGLRYAYEDFSPSYTAGSVAGHLFALACQAANHLEVLYIPPAEAAALTPGEPDYEAHVATVLANVLRMRRARLAVEDKATFLQYYNSLKRGYRPKAD